MNKKYLFFDTLPACHENLYNYIENVLDGLNTDGKVPE